jgi:hypothetical protein
MLKNVTPRISPIVKHLIAKNVASDAPVSGVPRILQMIMACHQIVEIGDLECGVIEPRAVGMLKQEKAVMIGRLCSAITAQKRPKSMSRHDLDLVRRQQSKPLLVPKFADAKIADVEHAMPEPDDRCWLCSVRNRTPNARAGAAMIPSAQIARDGQFWARFLTSNDFDAATIRIR